MPLQTWREEVSKHLEQLITVMNERGGGGGGGIIMASVTKEHPLQGQNPN